MKRRCILLITFLVCYSTLQAQKDSLRIAFYNCENYFDSFRDSSINDADYTANGKRSWTYGRFLAKRNSIFKVLATMGSATPPEVIGLCEIENRFVLNQLCYATPLTKHEYAVVHQNSSDARGIDVALIYQKNRLKLLTYRYYNPNTIDNSIRTRSILHATFRWGDYDTLHIFVNHLPSKLGGDKSERSRRLVVHLLKSKIDSIINRTPTASIIVTGDFNDTPTSPSLEELSDSTLVNLALPLSQKGQGSIKFEGKWELIDQMIVTKSLERGDTPVSLKGAMHIHSCPFMIEDDPDYGGQKPRRTFIGFKYNNGYSDHLPVFIDLKRDM